MKEKLVIVTARLAFAMPADADLNEVFDDANMALIPLQRREGGNSGLIDYTLSNAQVSSTPVKGYDYDKGFTDPKEPK